MKTYGFDFGLRENGKIYEFKSRKHAAGHGNGILVATTAEEIIASRVTIQQMVSLYNRFFDKQPVKEFSSKQVAARAMIALAQAKAIKAVTEDRSESMSESKKEKAPKAPKVKAEKIAGNGRKGRNSMFDGRTFKPAAGLTENPRRETAKGFKSMEIILAHPQGISYEDFLAKGGRRVDLAWDLVRDRVVAA